MVELNVLEPEKKTVKFKEEPKMSFIVPIYDIEAGILKRCLISLQDQDYANLEVIMVYDGANPELEKIGEFFLKDSWKKVVIEHAGACAARNAGFKESTGEIVSFFNSDYIAKPGMARMWSEALVDNPDFGFAYSGYEYRSSHRSLFPSGPFDSRQLEVENYIDCGFPLWRKYVVDWDVNCKSLQDWDFWLRVVKAHNVKGFFMSNEYSFYAEPPRPKGLSHDSTTNWNDRVNFVREKNGVTRKDILVDSLGAANHGKEIAKMLDADFRVHTWHKTDWMETYKAIYMIGFYIKPHEIGLNEHARRLALFKEKSPKAKRIVHFVGADIYWLRKFPWESLKYLAAALKQSCDTILCENQTAHDELLEYGIPTQIVPIPSYTSNWEVKPLPKDFRVAIYLVEPGNSGGKSDFDKYCYEYMLSIVRGMPDVQFTGYGPGAVGIQYPNLKLQKFIPREKWADFVYEQSALLRICRHDHNPMASNEFLMAGRDVITNIPTPYAHYIDTSGKDEISKWDLFGEGLNAYHWPDTKKKIIQGIRGIKKFQTSNNLPALNDAFGTSSSLKKTLDKQIYINKIRELCNV